MSINAISENTYVYTDPNAFIAGLLGIIGVPVLAIISLISGNLGGLVICVFAFFACYYLRKHASEGVVLDLNNKILSYPIFDPKCFKTPYPRKEIPIDEIQKVSGYVSIEITKKNEVKQTFDLTVYGNFGFKKFLFRNIEERNQFYTLLDSVGHFDTV
jgi:hypothetical protein